jgi:hypothetical protein
MTMETTIKRLLKEHTASDIIHAVLNNQPEDDNYIIASIWSVEDVRYQATCDDIQLDTIQAIDLLNTIDDKHDASIGINWDVIDCHISMKNY